MKFSGETFTGDAVPDKFGKAQVACMCNFYVFFGILLTLCFDRRAHRVLNIPGFVAIGCPNCYLLSRLQVLVERRTVESVETCVWSQPPSSAAGAAGAGRTEPRGEWKCSVADRLRDVVTRGGPLCLAERVAERGGAGEWEAPRGPEDIKVRPASGRAAPAIDHGTAHMMTHYLVGKT